MKIKDNFKLREIAGEHVLMTQNKDVVDMMNVMVFNNTSKYLWERFLGDDFEEEDVSRALLDKYEIKEDLAKKDAKAWMEKLEKLNIIS